MTLHCEKCGELTNGRICRACGHDMWPAMPELKPLEIPASQIPESDRKLKEWCENNPLPTEPAKVGETTGYKHPTTLLEFEAVYRKEYQQELNSSEAWIKWAKERGDYYGVNFHQGIQGALIFHNIKMEQLLRVLKQEEPNKAMREGK